MASSTPSTRSESSATATPPSAETARFVSDDDANWRAWHHAARRSDIDRDIRQLYKQLDAQVSSRGPTCWLSGKCCNFDAFGHRLYVTALEIAWVIAQTDPQPDTPAPHVSTHSATDTQEHSQLTRGVHNEPRPSGSGQFVVTKRYECVGNTLATVDPHSPCPFQTDKLCSIHAVRPLGCRIFFCQQGTDQWQHDLYEDFLTKLRRLHDQHALPYRYLEWRHGLRQAMAHR